MKNNSILMNLMIKKVIGCFLLLIAFFPFVASSQADTTKADEPELISPLIDFTCLQKSDNTIDLKGIFKAKIQGVLTRLEGLKVEFYSVDADTKLGEAVTDKNGLAILNTNAGALTPDTAGRLNFRVSYAGDKKTESGEEVLAVKRAKLVVAPVKNDSLNAVRVKLIDVSTGTELPVAETDLGLFVKRLFNPLKIGEGKTDEEGEVSIDVPADLPGDAKGNLFLIARLQDNEEYGNIEASIVQNWGKPVSTEMKELPRALWSTHPPVWMLVTFIILMGTVWGHYIVIVYELFRLKGEH